jgi:predicted TIM-barrel fold metal-dependent hydrolase
VDEYNAQTRFHNVDKVVHVEVAFDSTDPVEETRWLQQLSDRTGRPNAILGFCDFAASDASAVIQGHTAHGAFRGFRGRGDAAVFDDQSWRRGYELLSAKGLLFCHTVGWENIAYAQRLAADFPDVTFCLDQAGMPKARDTSYFRSWRTALQQLAQMPNAVCKISSLAMCDPDWSIDSLRPWVTACIDIFGPDRCFFGSNWPIDGLFSGYGDLINAYREIVSAYSDSDQQSVLWRTAERVFAI